MCRILVKRETRKDESRLLAVPLWIVERASKYAIGDQPSERK